MINNLHITLQQVKVFDAVARLLSYTRAAEELCLTQPAVSNQVKKLEENLDLKLVEVIGKRLHLTSQGLKVAQTCEQMLNQMQQLKHELNAIGGDISGTLSIAMVTPGKYFMAYVLKAFLQEYPRVLPQISVVNRSAMVDELKHKRAEIAIMGRASEQAQLMTVPFLENRLVMVAPSGHPLTKKNRIRLKDLVKEDFLLRELGSGIRETLENRLAQEKLSLQPFMELGSTEAIKQGVIAGLGISLLPLHALRLELQAGCVQVLDVEGFPLYRTWYAAYPEEAYLSPAAKAFMDFIRTVDMHSILPKIE